MPGQLIQHSPDALLGSQGDGSPDHLYLRGYLATFWVVRVMVQTLFEGIVMLSVLPHCLGILKVGIATTLHL